MTSKESAEKGQSVVWLNDLESRIACLRAKPLLILCRTPTGKEQAMTIQECQQTRSAYIRVLVPDELDELLEKTLGERTSFER